MTLWYGLLPSLLLAPVSANEALKAKVDANYLVADAVAAEATWWAIPGFMADLEIERNGVVSQGRLIVERDGRVFVELVPDSHRVWAVQHLSCIVGQLLPNDDLLNKSWMFVNLPRERTRLGYAVSCTDAPFGPCYWIHNQRFQAIEVRFAKSKQRLATLKTERNPENKHLPTVQVLHLWDARTKELKAAETRLLCWRRMGGFDLPTTIQVLSAGTAADPMTPAMGRIVLTRHQLFSIPATLFASRYDRRLP
jgi:hypothetical protein